MERTKRLLCVLLVVCLLAAALTVLAASNPSDGGELVVVLDPGHGGKESGSEQHWHDVQTLEKDLNLKIAQYCKQALERDYANVTVYMTRTDDTYLDLLQRAEYAKSVNADIMVSLHNNASGLPNSQLIGAEALVPNGNYRPDLAEWTKTVAASILNELSVRTGVSNRGFVLRDSSSYFYPDDSVADYYGVIRHSITLGFACTIIEHAFMDNLDDFDNYLSTDEKLRALGEADAAGIAKAYGLKAKGDSAQQTGDAPFTDVYVGAWYYDTVTRCYRSGLMNGVGSDSFNPQGGMTRAMLVTVLWRMNEMLQAGEPQQSAPSDGEYNMSFEDVPDGMYYTDAVIWAHRNGIVTGFDEAHFEPDRPVSREQMAAILYRYCAFADYDTSAAADLTAFEDEPDVSDYAHEALSWANAVGLIQGVRSGEQALLSPRSGATRAQVATILIRFLDLTESLVKQPEEQPPVQPDDPGTPGEPEQPYDLAPPLESTGDG